MVCKVLIQDEKTKAVLNTYVIHDIGGEDAGKTDNVVSDALEAGLVELGLERCDSCCEWHHYLKVPKYCDDSIFLCPNCVPQNKGSIHE